ncbi:uncharacterized protein B0J16DRAFT_331060 [Fusarium flagelliforme]|uniref:uncharacterized protein n=1 Tax=Fusarium flagelliforme TaxID=2675880 RepID=UPI001E8E6B3A|nr:uncharacterized protein B0J16DRAFT_331060 [Fusarium flagelliforme]KAH7198748.1 hypothetical protein B0J16DRAFT_331060 [Fusarium flagelliforme]
MASLCNYTHPELQITEGLVRHDAGILFPYNPEFYDTATGLYGPGAIYCWYMLLASVLASWFYGYAAGRRPTLSSDLVGALAYPAFAATDLLRQCIGMIGIKDRGVAISCLAFDSHPTPGFYYFSTEPLDMKKIPPEVLDLGQRIIDILGPCKVSWTAGMFLCLLMLSFIRLDKVPAPKLRNMTPCYLVIFATFSYICLSLTFFYFSMGDFGEAYLQVIFEIFHQVILMATPILITLVLSLIPVSIVTFISSWKKGEEVAAQAALKNIKDGGLVMAVFILPSIWMIFYLDMSNIPDLAIRITERDQLATLIVGVVTLIYTILDLLDLIPVPAEVVIDDEAIEMLAPQDVEESDSTTDDVHIYL